MLYTLVAQDPAPAKPPGDMPFWMNPLFLIAMFMLFWVVFILPMSRRQKKEQQQMMSTIKRGAKVVTSAGIIGTVVTVKDTEDEVTLRSEDARIKVLKSSIARVLGQDESEAK